MYSSTLSLTSALDPWGGMLTPLLGRFTSEMTRYIILYRRLGGLQVRFGRVRKISPPLGIDPRIVQPLARRFTNYTFPTHNLLKFNQ